MSNLFDESSLAMIPTAYKDGKLYSVRPTPEYGAEEVTNGDFATDSDWNKNSNWTISGGVAIADGSSDLDMNQGTTIATIGKSYKITYEVVNISQGGFFFKFGGVNGVPKYSVGVYTEIIQAVNTNRIALDSENNAIGSIDNVSVKEVLVNGDFTFSRGSNLSATRVNASQLIEKGRENVLLQSNSFSTSPWGTSSAIALSGYAGRNGGTNAWLLREQGSISAHWIRQSSGLTSGIGTFSFYAKKKDYDWIQFAQSGDGGDYANFNIVNGTLGNSASGLIDTSITSVGNGWYRCSVTYSFGSNSFVGIALIRSDVSSRYETYQGDNISGTYIQDAQVELGLVATPYIETGASTAQAGILENTPRLDYSGGASCPSLLLEPSRTQLVKNSEYFDSYLISGTPTMVVNAATSPEGLNNAYSLSNSSGSDARIRHSSIATTNGTKMVVSIFAKVNGNNTFNLRHKNLTYFRVTLDLSNQSYTGGGTWVDDLTFEDYGNGWYRCLLFLTPLNTEANTFEIELIDGDSIFAYGFQIEQAAYPTSYIPNHSGGTITRSEDSTGILTYDISANSITAFVEADMKDLIRDNSNSNILIGQDDNIDGSISIYRNSTSSPRRATIVARNLSSSNAVLYEVLTDNPKIAVNYNSTNGNWKLFIDGVKVVDVIDSDFNPFDTFYFKGAGGTIGLKQFILWNTPLSDVECIALTTI